MLVLVPLGQCELNLGLKTGMGKTVHIYPPLLNALDTFIHQLEQFDKDFVAFAI